MPTREKSTKISITIDDPTLSTAIKDAAAAEAKPIRRIVAEALRDWLKRREELEDLYDTITAEESRRDPAPTITLEEYAKHRGWDV